MEQTNAVEVCRFCLYILDETSSQLIWKNNCYTKIKQTLEDIGIIISMDNLPNKICTECFKIVNQLSSFKKKIAKNEEFLISAYAKELDNERGTVDLDLSHNCQNCGVFFTDSYVLSKHFLECNSNNLFELSIDEREISVVDKSENNDIEILSEEVIRNLIQEKKIFTEEIAETKIDFDETVTIGELFVVKTKRKVNTNTETCRFCCQSLDTEADTMLHFLQHVMQGTKYMNHRKFCTICGKIPDSQEDLNLHTQKYHNLTDVHQCRICGIMCKSKYSLLEHDHIGSNENLKSGTFKCPICQEIFEDQPKVIEHGLSHLASRYRCARCKEYYINESAYFAHSERHSKQRINCIICQKSFSSKLALKYHTNTAHTEAMILKCKFCSKVFKYDVTLKIHEKRHTASNVVCSICGFSTKNKTELKLHLRSHTNEKPFKCTFEGCTQAYKMSSHLSKHVKIHLNIRNHCCTFCNKRFIAADSLSRHLVIHTGERSFQCTICPSKFKRKDHLRVHMKHH